MNDDRRRRLMHEWLDGELDPEGAEELLAELREDRGHLAELEELELLVEAAARLPDPPLPPGFVQRTMARIERAAPRHSPLRAFFSRRFELRLAHAAAAAAAFALVTAGASFVAFREGRDRAARALAVADATAGELVRFSYGAPARKVELAGDFNGWKPQPLERRPDGTFEVVLPLAKGRYEYALRVDGDWQPDPSARLYVEDGFGGRNSVLDF